jgi:hypothetical protein
MLGRQTLLAAALVVASLGAPQLVGTAAGHCPDGAESTIVAGISTCEHNEELERTVDRLNEATGDEQVYVLVKDLGFHPPVAEVADGGTIVLVWGDVEGNEQHDPRSSGVGDDAECRNAHEDPVDCRPNNPGACFSLSDASAFLSEPGDTYEVTMRVNDDGNVEVSEGQFSGAPVVGQPPFSPRFRECPQGTSATGPGGSLVVPYHCGIHGGANTVEQMMRGAIVLGG